MAKEAYSMEHNSTLYHLFSFLQVRSTHINLLIEHSKPSSTAEIKFKAVMLIKKKKKSFWNSAEHHLHYIFIDIFFFFYNLILFHTAVAFYFQDWIIKKKSEYIAKKKRRGMAILPCCQTIKHFKKLRVCPNCWFFFCIEHILLLKQKCM